ncbi:Hypothetical protein RY67_611 [Bifidobacterium longum subsp. infantis]|uniref:Uncharacterized protein n=1 Tax=Bifidobacterium longum subsp. infantis TaxID=1682 RepID=A0A0M4LQJ2_BIFLI|nr:Hypothetical protein RY67_611 [Bifidobacterium longum subsp. infantis]
MTENGGIPLLRRFARSIRFPKSAHGSLSLDFSALSCDV